MTVQFGFCNNCGAPRTTGAASFCASCGASLPAVPGVAGASATPPPAQPWGAPPPPPAQPWTSATPQPPQAPWAEAAPQQPQQPWTSAAQQPPQQAPWVGSTQQQPVQPQQAWSGAPAPQWGGQLQPQPRRKGMNPLVIVGAIILIAVLAIGGMFMLVGAHGGTANATPTSGAGSTAAATQAGGNNGGSTAAPTQAGGNGSGLSGASSAFANISSFKFSMTLAGGSFGDMLSAFGGAGATSGAPFTMSGTITLKPDKAADITMGGFHIIEIGGYDYIDMGLGSYIKSAVSGSSSMADSFSPETMFSGMVGTSSSGDYNKVGTETKNGVQADHYQATSAALSVFSGTTGVTGATWTSDVWIAVSGGYPVSFSVIGTAPDNSVAYEVAFDISAVNDPGNKISAPTNVTGS